MKIILIKVNMKLIEEKKMDRIMIQTKNMKLECKLQLPMKPEINFKIKIILTCQIWIQNLLVIMMMFKNQLRQADKVMIMIWRQNNHIGYKIMN